MFIYWGMMISVPGMYTMYITEMGFSKKEIGIAVTIYTISCLIGQSFIGFLVDKFRCPRKIMLLFICAGLFVALGFNFAELNWHIYMLLFIWGFFVSGTIPLSEAWCIDTLKGYNEQRNFGKIRGFGSIGYGLSGPFFGFILQKLGWVIYPWYTFIAVSCTLVILLLMSDRHAVGHDLHGDKVVEKISLKEGLNQIFSVKPLIGIIAIMFMYVFVVRGIYSYLGVLVADFGGGALSLGFTYFFDATPEVVTFFLAAMLLKKYHSKKLIFAAVLLQIIRLTVILIFNNAAAVILMGILSGFAFGLVAASYKTYIYDLAPAKYKASCLSLAESLIGISGIISAPVFGFMFSRFGTNSTILFGLAIFTVLILVMLKDIMVKNN